MKIAVVNLLDSFPPRTGGSNRTFELVKILSVQNDVALYIRSIYSSVRFIKKYYSSLRIINSKYSYKKFRKNFLIRTIDIVLSSLLFVIDIRKKAYNIVIIEYGRIQSLFFFFFCKLFAKSILCIDSHNVEVIIKLRLNQFWFLTFLAEKLILKNADFNIFVSKNDLKLSHKIYNYDKQRTAILHNFLDRKKDNLWDPKVIRVNTPKILFIGSLKYYPNIEAILNIDRKIIPILKNEGIKLLFLVCGHGRKPVINNDDYFQFLGYVGNLSVVIKDCSVAIAPISCGSGTRVKIIDYFKNGIPVVSTKIGAEGLLVKNEKNIIITDDWKKFSKSIQEIIKDFDLAQNLGRNGNILYEKEYSKSYASKEIRKIIKKAVITQLDYSMK
ncbi:MAG: glycosyltransferase family 4 protein [Candidatus Hodarchaeota archaeon]